MGNSAAKDKGVGGPRKADAASPETSKRKTNVGDAATGGPSGMTGTAVGYVGQSPERAETSPGRRGSAGSSNSQSEGVGPRMPQSAAINIPQQGSPSRPSSDFEQNSLQQMSVFGSPLESLVSPGLPPLDNEGFRDRPHHIEAANNRVLFRWRDSTASSVTVSGSFNKWKEPIQLRHIGNGEFEVALTLPSGSYEYKYQVDGVWRHDDDREIVRTSTGSINNIVTVVRSLNESIDNSKGGWKPNSRSPSSMKAPSTLPLTNESLSDLDMSYGSSASHRPGTPPGEYGQIVPDLATAAPPAGLPPHLLQVPLNMEIRNGDATQLAEPNHVMLNHLYALSIRDGVMVLGTTHRYRQKYVTTVIYKPVA